MTPDMVFTLSRRAAHGSSPEAADLGAIRRAEAIIDLLASRKLRQPAVLHDPAVLLLGALAADVDAAAGPPAAAVPAARLAQAGHPPAAAWVRVAAAVAVITTVAGAAATGMAVSGLVLRWARQLAPPARDSLGRP